MKSANLERAKFMEGASWIGNKAKIEAHKFSQKLRNIQQELQK